MAVSVASTHTWQLEQLSADTSPSTTNTTNNPTTGTGRSRSSSNLTTLRMESAPTSSTSRAVADPSSDPSNGPSGIPSPQVGLSAGPGQLYHSSATNPFQPQPSPNQQQQQWTPSPNAAPFYPQFTPFFHPAATPPVVPQPHQAYFDPNQQIAWAYQQMMIQQAAIAQQHHQNQFNQAMAEFGRTRANSGGPQGASGPATPNDFFPPPPGPHQNPLIPGFPFNAGTPPAHPYNGSPQQSFRGRGTPRSNTFDNQDWNRLTAQGLPIPYARPEAAGSSHSINSSNGSTTGGGGGGASSRTRTNSNNTNKSQTPPSSLRGHGHMHSYGGGQNSPSRGHTVPQLTTDFERPRQQGQQSARQGSSGPPSPAVTRTQPHQRTVSNTSDRTASSTRGQSASSSPTVATSSNNSIMGGSVASTAASTAGQPSSSSANGSPNLSPISRTNQRGPAKPSPLSQQQTFAEAAAGANNNNSTNAKRAKRLSKDDSELLPPTTVANALSARQSGLKGRFKRALAFNPPQALDESADGASSIGHGDISPNGSASGALHVSGGDGGDISSPVTPVNSGDNVRSKPKSRLFSGKFNASTDNISLSSTVSSASVMIRKLGSIGKLARRNTLTNITGIFKGDKNKDKEGKKSKKGDKSEPSVSHATVEVDRGEDEPSLAGLSPAARVARQHTLKSNAEAARRLREQAAATSAAVAAAAMTGSSAPSALPDAWEKNTTNNHSRRPEASTSSGRGVSEDGTLREDRSDDGSGEGGYDPQYDPDATIRMNTGVDLEEDDEDEPWAVGLRRSIEKTRTPGKPVIKNHVGYIQEHHLDPPNQPFAARIRSNSYQTVAESQPGPLAHLPSPDPDHIDGLQRSSSTHNTPEKKSFSLPAFSFEFGDAIDILPKEDGEGETDSPAEQQEPLSSAAASGSAGASGTGALANAADKGPTFAYTHPTANSSAPALSTMFNPNNKNAGAANATGGSHLTGLKKHITFAATLSIYDTFSSSAYDRRSEPSTANRLTPALAQRIKEELNSYKMEEMEVHSASKIHTHFFV